MSKDPVMECIKKYQKHIHLAVTALTELFTDTNISSQASQEMKSRAAAVYICLLDIGKISSLKNSAHISLLSQQIEEYLKNIPQEEINEAEFQNILNAIDHDVVVDLEGGNC